MFRVNTTQDRNETRSAWLAKVKLIAYGFICGRAPIMADNYYFQIEARVDIAIYPANSIHPAQLIQMADKALYEVREFGRNIYRCDAHRSGPEKPVYGKRAPHQ